MITSELNTDGYTGHILIEPNRPISWTDNVKFIKLFALVSFVIGMIFYLQGFLLVLPFSGIEVVIVAYALYLVFKHYSVCQIIYFTEDSVIIESGDQQADQRIEYQRHWSKFHVDNDGTYKIPRLIIRSKGNTTEIGAFLSYTDKLTLINLIKQLTSSFQSSSTSTL